MKTVRKTTAMPLPILPECGLDKARADPGFPEGMFMEGGFCSSPFFIAAFCSGIHSTPYGQEPAERTVPHRCQICRDREPVGTESRRINIHTGV